MSVLYRSIFSDDRPALVDDARTTFESWVKWKGVGLPIPDRGSVSDGAHELGTTHARDGHVEALRLKLTEERPLAERWATTLTVMRGPAEAHLWVDLERVTEDVFGPPFESNIPRLVGMLIEAGSARVGSVPLTFNPAHVGEEGLSDLVGTLLDAQRSIPIVVATPDEPGAQSGEVCLERAGRLARSLYGIAVVYALQAETAAALSDVLGDDLAAIGGAYRTYLPGLSVEEGRPFRHRHVEGDEVRRDPVRAAGFVTLPLIRQATAARPPVLYREQIAVLPGFRRHADEDTLAFAADLIVAERERDALRDQLAEEVAMRVRAERNLDDVQRRVNFLEQELGESAARQPTPEPVRPATAGTSVEALGLAQAHLPLLVIRTDTVVDAGALDECPYGPSWAHKSWQALSALNDYAQAKASSSRSFRGNFATFCQTIWPGSVDVVMVESQSVRTNRRHKAARTFPVPINVESSGKAFMEAHIRIGTGSVAPRLHFHDNTAGATGKVYIGYLGPHLPSNLTS